MPLKLLDIESTEVPQAYRHKLVIVRDDQHDNPRRRVNRLEGGFGAHEFTASSFAAFRALRTAA